MDNIAAKNEIDTDNFIDDGVDYTVSEHRPSKAFKNVYDILEAFIYAIIAVLIIFTFFIRLTVVNGESMEGTLHNGEYLVVANVFFTYEPKNGDIVVIHGNFENYIEETSNHQYEVYPTYSDPIVKRVIATSGQTIMIDFKTSNVYVDGERLDEEYRNELLMGVFADPRDFLREYKSNTICYDEKTGVLTATVPEDHCFVMGDNRNHSADSRHRDIGFIPKEFIIGKAIFRLSPFTIF